MIPLLEASSGGVTPAPDPSADSTTKGAGTGEGGLASKAADDGVTPVPEDAEAISWTRGPVDGNSGAHFVGGAFMGGLFGSTV